ncbi:hypothetical protein LguiA_003167 [Lonicera macranthoides]
MSKIGILNPRKIVLPDRSKKQSVYGSNNEGCAQIFLDISTWHNLIGRPTRQWDMIRSSLYQLVSHGGISQLTPKGVSHKVFSSEFGNDVDRMSAVEPAKTKYAWNEVKNQACH